jgi:hypothetical protein
MVISCLSEARRAVQAMRVGIVNRVRHAEKPIADPEAELTSGCSMTDQHLIFYPLSRSRQSTVLYEHSRNL